MRQPSESTRVSLSILAWFFGGITFFPIFWMVITSMKTEAQAIASTPMLFFWPTFANLSSMLQSGDYLHFAANSVIISFGDGILPDPQDKGPPALDAFDENDAVGRRARTRLPDLP